MQISAVQHPRLRVCEVCLTRVVMCTYPCNVLAVLVRPAELGELAGDISTLEPLVRAGRGLSWLYFLVFTGLVHSNTVSHQYR
jgi:hypothetical protein